MKCCKDNKNYHWSDEEVYFLEQNYYILNNKDISSKIKRSVNSIRSKAFSLGLRKNLSTQKVDLPIPMPNIIYVKQTFEIYPSKINFE